MARFVSENLFPHLESMQYFVASFIRLMRSENQTWLFVIGDPFNSSLTHHSLGCHWVWLYHKIAANLLFCCISIDALAWAMVNLGKDCYKQMFIFLRGAARQSFVVFDSLHTYFSHAYCCRFIARSFEHLPACPLRVYHVKKMVLVLGLLSLVDPHLSH